MQEQDNITPEQTADNEQVPQQPTEDAAAESKSGKKQKQLKKEVAELTEQVSKLEAANEELQAKYVAIIAEYSNYRKRSTQEKDDLFQASTAAAVTAFLPLLDNLERAVSYAPDDAGLAALQKQFCEILTKLGVTEMRTENAQFDPNLHNAIMHDEDESQPENTIVTTFAKGYMLGDRVVRHAMVKVVN